MDIRKLGLWLGLTPQEFDILQCIYRLQLDGVQASPKVIQNKYRRRHGKILEKANLFKIARRLISLGYVVKKGRAEYILDFDGVQTGLDRKKSEYVETLDEFEELTGKLHEKFKKIVGQQSKPIIKYFNQIEYMQHVSKKLLTAKKYFITSKFPGIAYTYGPYSMIDRQKYYNVLLDRCMHKRDLDVNYLTSLDLDYPYSHSLKFYNGNTEKAKKECNVILDNLQNIMEEYDNIKIYTVDNPYGLDIILPENTHPEDLYLFIRNPKMDVIGGIYIKNQDLATKSKETFQTICKNATPLTGATGKRIISKTRKKIPTL